MEKFTFAGLTFRLEDDVIAFDSLFGIPVKKERGRIWSIAQVLYAGSNWDSHLGNKFVGCSDLLGLRYISRKLEGNTLSILQRGQDIEVTTVYETLSDHQAVSCYSIVKNISKANLTLEYISSLVVYGLNGGEEDHCRSLYFYRFGTGHSCECQPARSSFFDRRLFLVTGYSQRTISYSNIGSWSTKEELPLGIIEDAESSRFLMFQIESNSSWHYEIGDFDNDYYLSLSGPDVIHHDFAHQLKPGESYRSTRAEIAFGHSLDEVIAGMTAYRRHLRQPSPVDSSLPVIFNEYMHLSWDSPNEKRSESMFPVVEKTGAEYYVVDCGWHDEVPGNIIYSYLGSWRQSQTRFPSGLAKLSADAAKHHLKLGLWIEPEIVSNKNEERLSAYPEYCFYHRNGKRVQKMGKYILDFRLPEVRKYLDETIDLMVDTYGACYIKSDNNIDFGPGTEDNATSLGDGLIEERRAYLAWVDGVRKRHPDVIFESCSSGGLRMDYQQLSHFDLVSSSDQTHYQKYPYIAANILSAILPEQAAVWSYPVDSHVMPNHPNELSVESVERDVSEEAVAFNMINALLGRMHLASHLELLSPKKFQMVQDGVAYYHYLTPYKLKADPVFPLGFTNFFATFAAAGLRSEKKLFLAVWNLDRVGSLSIPLKAYGAIKAKVGYPVNLETSFALVDGLLTINFPSKYSARFFEIDLA